LRSANRAAIAKSKTTMPMNRRQFLIAAAGSIAVSVPAVNSAQSQNERRYNAVAFDAFVIFDPRPIFALAAELIPEKGEDFVGLWRTRQFEYMWLRTLSGRYADFPTATRDALVFAARTLKVDLAASTKQRLLDGYFQLKAWPDVVPALRRLKDAGLRLGFLSNFSDGMLAANLESAELKGYFEQSLSTDRVKAFKPDPRAYRMGVDAFGLAPGEIVFAAFAGWDAAGAKSFGYPTFWVNRQNSVEEQLDVHPDAAGGIDELVKFAIA
jgi:2-haloacid dehalogenase